MNKHIVYPNTSLSSILKLAADRLERCKFDIGLLIHYDRTLPAKLQNAGHKVLGCGLGH